MKKYPTFDTNSKLQATRRKYEGLLFFQEMLRTCDALNERYHGKALEIADGLQPWIDALAIDLEL